MRAPVTPTRSWASGSSTPRRPPWAPCLPRRCGRPARRSAVRRSASPRDRALCAVLTPSATCFISVKMSSSERPRPSSMPTRRLRDSSPVHVSTRSPMPARPDSVSGLPPMRTAMRLISARPRVMIAARELWPRPRPSDIPAAMAMTFLSAPPTCTPTTSFSCTSERRRWRTSPGPPARSPRSAGHGDDRRQALHHFLGERRPRQHRDVRVVGLGQALLEHLRHGAQRAGLNALGDGDDGDVGAGRDSACGRAGAGGLRGRAHHDQLRASRRGLEVGGPPASATAPALAGSWGSGASGSARR